MNLTPLHPAHIKLNAKMAAFASYDMPLSYGVIRDEVMAVREGAGLFDISHMVVIEITGSQRFSFLEPLTPRVVASIKPGRLQYNVLLNAAGGIVDDVVFVRTVDDRFFIISNAANRKKVAHLLKSALEAAKAQVQVLFQKDYILLALQGPQAHRYSDLFYPDAESLFFYENGWHDGCLVMRGGYSGEDGFELFCDIPHGQKLWQQLTQLGAIPCGLAARDLLRLEAFYPLYGNELNEELTPANCNIGWLISDKKDYYGKTNILAQKANPTQVTLGFRLLEAGVPRGGYGIFSKEEQVGVVTSGSFSFIFNSGFGLMRIHPTAADKALSVEIRGQKKKIEVLEQSPYTSSIRRRNK